MLFMIFFHKWKWNEASYDTLFKIIGLLTNLHVEKFPPQKIISIFLFLQSFVFYIQWDW